MTTPDEITAWRENFIREFALDRDELDEALPMDERPTARLPEQATAGQRPEQRIPARYATALATDPDVRAWMAVLVRQATAERRVYVTVTSGPSLLLLGPTGTGKTFQAYGMIRGLARLGVRAKSRATTAADFYARLRPRHGIDSEAVFEEYAGATLLVIDDLGAMKNSEWIEEINYRLVNHRYERLLPTLFTSNLLPKDLANTLGERVSSRLAEMTERVTLKGADRRYAA
jgi:DNA replication protein DnaC